MNNLLLNSFKWISHRGNQNGPSEWENHPEAIQEALDAGFDVEVDIWYWEDKFWLGHDRPEYRIDKIYDGFNFDISDQKLWIHAKNLKAFEELYKNSNINFFWHTDEDIILTTKQYIWTYPGVKLLPGAILVMPESVYKNDGVIIPNAINTFIDSMQAHIKEYNSFVGAGICSDYIFLLKNKLCQDII